LLKSSSPSKVEIQALLQDKDLVSKFSNDVRKYSHNYEGSLFFENYNFGMYNYVCVCAFACVYKLIIRERYIIYHINFLWCPIVYDVTILLLRTLRFPEVRTCEIDEKLRLVRVYSYFITKSIKIIPLKLQH